MWGPLIAIAAAAVAPAQSADLPGIWEGTVGNLPVRACFVQREWSPFGAYYYMSQRRLIPLDAEEGASGAFREGGGDGADRPRWLIQQAGPDRLTARWTGNGRTLPVRLRRLARMEGEEGPCGSIVFHRPRLEGVRTVTGRGSVDGVPYTRLTLSTEGRFETSVETFALNGSSEAVQRINAELGRTLAGDPPSWFECIQDSLSHSPFEGSFAESLAPVMIARRWMSVASHWDGFCGGAHPNSSNTYRTFDLTSGAEIDLHDWFTSAAVKRERLEEVGADSVTLEPAFREVILAGWRAELECDDVVRSADFWNIGLTREAFRFSPSLPHVAQACGDEFTLPFERVRAFLTEDGAENLRALQRESAP